tara:strand:+ start:1289 stop:1858 length:570 start_codon:yes stop_codon:yes gene_type:complete
MGSIKKKILESAIVLAAESDWNTITLDLISKRADVSVSRVYEYFPTKATFLCEIMTQTNRAILKDYVFFDSEEPEMDKLLEILMARFDVLKPRKSAIASMLRSVGTDPVTLLLTFPEFIKSISLMLQVAGFNISGFTGLIRVKVTGFIYLSTMRVWLKDNSQDLTKTMAHLDKSIRIAKVFIQSSGSEQ